jgi:sodium-dependent dicarboxylate transporter 2/3/5
MLPVATAPNAVVFGTGRIPAARMAREGLVFNLLAAVAIAGVCSLRL